MKISTEYVKNHPFTRWDFIVVAAVLVVVIALLAVVLPPRDVATKATVYVDGKAVSTLDLGAEYNKVATYSGVRVQVSDGSVETIYRGQKASVSRAGDKIVYPTLGVVVELE